MLSCWCWWWWCCGGGGGGGGVVGGGVVGVVGVSLHIVGLLWCYLMYFVLCVVFICS